MHKRTLVFVVPDCVTNSLTFFGNPSAGRGVLPFYLAFFFLSACGGCSLLQGAEAVSEYAIVNDNCSVEFQGSLWIAATQKMDGDQDTYATLSRLSADLQRESVLKIPSKTAVANTIQGCVRGLGLFSGNTFALLRQEDGNSYVLDYIVDGLAGNSFQLTNPSRGCVFNGLAAGAVSLNTIVAYGNEKEMPYLAAFEKSGERLWETNLRGQIKGVARVISAKRKPDGSTLILVAQTSGLETTLVILKLDVEGKVVLSSEPVQAAYGKLFLPSDGSDVGLIYEVWKNKQTADIYALRLKEDFAKKSLNLLESKVPPLMPRQLYYPSGKSTKYITVADNKLFIYDQTDGAPFVKSGEFQLNDYPSGVVGFARQKAGGYIAIIGVPRFDKKAGQLVFDHEFVKVK